MKLGNLFQTYKLARPHSMIEHIFSRSEVVMSHRIQAKDGWVIPIMIMMIPINAVAGCPVCGLCEGVSYGWY
jgi:hypothetical protein